MYSSPTRSVRSRLRSREALQCKRRPGPCWASVNRAATRRASPPRAVACLVALLSRSDGLVTHQTALRRTTTREPRTADRARHSARQTPYWGRCRAVPPASHEPAVFLRRHSGMTTDDSDDLLRVNCGRCGMPLIRSIEDLGDQRTIDCANCAKTLPVDALAELRAASSKSSLFDGEDDSARLRLRNVCCLGFHSGELREVPLDFGHSHEIVLKCLEPRLHSVPRIRR